ncbi:MAG TPA: tryptophan--tRNA ligase [Candidatus Woesebacteria bacterium]|nr:tryptophan--tRNA ligase [Candidatus Woesebacteria bacterium]HPJ16637.1 tryptophan--tRNA ligase [Candidatus Woesebacteria bacterium]
MSKPRILTGDRPTGPLHIGHYFGALKDRVALQDKYDTFVIIADVQALTDNFLTPQKVRDNVKEVVMDNLASGIDPQKSTIFIQSMIPEIAELTVYYSNLVTVSRLERNPTTKEELKQKEKLFKNNITYGFLGYPVSQAADITAFKADLVPVGEDQLPHIELAREIARKFNDIYGQVLVEPKAKVSNFPRVKGLDGNSKMGKSLNNAIYLSDSPDTIRQKVKMAFTDPQKIRLTDPGHPADCMVYYYHQMFTNPSDLKVIESECQSGARGCVACKNQLADNIIDFLSPIQQKRQYYQSHPEIVDQIIKEGTAKAKLVAADTLRQVKEKMFLNY